MIARRIPRLTLAVSSLIVAAGLIQLTPAVSAVAASPRHPNIILITVESLRADRLGCYTQGRRKTTPSIDALAARGVRFERSYAASPSTVPSIATVLTGLSPSAHGLLHDLGGRLSAEFSTVASILSESGYRTGAVTGSFHVDSDRGLDRGFDLYDDDIEDMIRLGVLRSKERRADEVVRRGVNFLDVGRKGQPVFLWLDLYDLHYDPDPRQPLNEDYDERTTYENELAHVDAQVASLIEALRTRNLEETTYVILAGSHGEGLGDHGETGHGVYVYESTIRVPLMVSPLQSPSRRVVRRVVGLIDVAPTILDLASIRVPSSMIGRSLVPFLTGEAPPGDEQDVSWGRRLLVESWQPWAAYGWSPLFAVIEGDLKVIKGRWLEAFDLDADPGETKPIELPSGRAADLDPSIPMPPDRRALGEAGRRRVLDEVAAMALPWDNSPICLEKQNWPDPRDRMALNDPLFRSRIDFDTGAAARAATISEAEILPSDPANFTALELVISLGIRNGWRDEVLDPLGMLVCNYPFRGAPYHYLAHYLEQRKDIARAEEALRLFGSLEPWNESAEYDLAVLFASQGKKEQAFSHLRKAISLGADNLDFIRKDGRLRVLRQDRRFAEMVGTSPPPAPAATQ